MVYPQEFGKGSERVLPVPRAATHEFSLKEMPETDWRHYIVELLRLHAGNVRPHRRQINCVPQDVGHWLAPPFSGAHRCIRTRGVKLVSVAPCSHPRTRVRRNPSSRPRTPPRKSLVAVLSTRLRANPPGDFASCFQIRRKAVWF